jgi:2-oxoglutarate dehydrogenase complex dehydrogenase (E1) component-like enzyme
LINDGVDEAALKDIDNRAIKHMENAYAKSKDIKGYAVEDWGNEEWEKIKIETKDNNRLKDTGCETEYLTTIGEKISTLPSNEKFHRSVAKIFDQRLESF